jgi:hypothetical protein
VLITKQKNNNVASWCWLLEFRFFEWIGEFVGTVDLDEWPGGGIGLGVGASWFFTNLFGPLGLLDFRLSACCITYMYILNKQEKVVYSFAS